MPRRFLPFLMAALLCGCADAMPARETPTPPGPAPDGSAQSASAPGGSVSASLPSSASSVAADDPPGTFTCALLGTAVSAGTLMNAGVVDAIFGAAGTADAPVADAAQRLATAYAAAVAAHGTDSEPDAIAAVSAAATDMSGICADSGLQSVG